MIERRQNIDHTSVSEAVSHVLLVIFAPHIPQRPSCGITNDVRHPFDTLYERRQDIDYSSMLEAVSHVLLVTSAICIHQRPSHGTTNDVRHPLDTPYVQPLTKIPLAKQNYLKFSYYYRVTALRNDLPVEVKNISSIKYFKNRIQLHYRAKLQSYILLDERSQQDYSNSNIKIVFEYFIVFCMQFSLRMRPSHGIINDVRHPLDTLKVNRQFSPVLQ